MLPPGTGQIGDEPWLLEFRDKYTVDQARLLEGALRSLAGYILAAEDLLLSVAVTGQDGKAEKVLSEKDTQGSRVFAGFLNHGARTISHLIRAYETFDLPLMSWAARNLVELRIWSRYASMSDETLRGFHDNSILDSLDLLELQLRALQQANAEVADIEAVQSHIQEVTEELKHSTLTSRKRLRIKDVAKDVGAEQYYKHWFGHLSKLAHPTPALILHVETGKEMVSVEITEPIFTMGLRAGTEIYNTSVKSMQFVDTPQQAKKPE